MTTSTPKRKWNYPKMEPTKRYPIHKTTNSTTGKVKELYTQNPIPEGVEFEVQHKGQTLRFRMNMHWITDETRSVIELVGIGKSCVVKRPRLGE